MCGLTRDVVIYSRFGPNPLGGLGARGVEIWRFRIIRLVASITACTTVQAVIYVAKVNLLIEYSDGEQYNSTVMTDRLRFPFHPRTEQIFTA